MEKTVQITGTSAVTAMWGTQATAASRQASAVDSPAVVEPVFARMYDNLTASDREVLFAATGAWINADGMLNIPGEKTFEELQAIDHFALQMDSDRRSGALTGEVSTGYLRGLVAEVGSGQGNALSLDVLGRALDFVASRDEGRPTRQAPLDVRA